MARGRSVVSRITQKIQELLGKDRRAVDEPRVIRSYYRDTFANPEFMQGQKVLDDLCKEVRFTKPLFHPDPYQTAFNLGAQSVVMLILDKANRPESSNITNGPDISE
jgi:hypothetical protein